MAEGGSLFSMLIPMGIMIGIFYFLMIRPQSKQRKLLQQKINNLKKGDKIITTGGIICIVANVKDNIVVGKIGNDVKIEINKGYIANVIDRNEAISQPKNKNSKKQLEVVNSGKDNGDRDSTES